MMKTNDLDHALATAFPLLTIDRAMIDEPTANWSVYDDVNDLSAFEGKSWITLPPPLLVQHSTLPIYAGDALFRATFPAYLRYLLHERSHFNDLPFQLAGQLTRKVDPASHAKFDRRVAPLTQAQREATRDALAMLSTVPPMEEAMSIAHATWNLLCRYAPA